MTLLRVEIPMKLPSTANLREFWAVKAKRVKAQRMAARLGLSQPSQRVSLYEALAATMRGEPLVCLLTRISPRKLDSDNLQSAFKGIRDQVAAELGIDDGSDAVRWDYAQESGKAAVRIEISRAAQALADSGRAAQFAPSAPDLTQLAAEPSNKEPRRRTVEELCNALDAAGARLKLDPKKLRAMASCICDEATNAWWAMDRRSPLDHIPSCPCSEQSLAAQVAS